MNRKYLNIILISFFMVTYNASADPKDLILEPLALANINCAAFYTAAQVMIKPEAKKEYESRSGMHYALSHRFTSSHGALSKQVNEEIQRLVIEGLSLKDHAQAVNFLSDNSIKCSVIEMNSTAVVTNHSLNQERTND